MYIIYNDDQMELGQECQPYNEIHLINILKEKNHMSISKDTQKAFEKI